MLPCKNFVNFFRFQMGLLKLAEQVINLRKRSYMFVERSRSHDQEVPEDDEVVLDSQPLTQPAASSQEVEENDNSSRDESREIRAWFQPLHPSLDRIDIGDSSIVVGRSDDDPVVDYNLNRLRKCGLAIWTTLSRRHFSIETKPEGTFVTDLSRNGTFINRELMGNGVTKQIVHRDVISLGHASFFSYMFEENQTDTELPASFHKKYLITGTVLGTGGYGKVVLGKVRDSIAKWVAIKMVAKTKLAATASRCAAHANDIKNEVACMTQVNHPNVVRIEELIETPNQAFMVLEYVDGGELYDRIVDDKRRGIGLGEKLTKFYALQMFDALKYLHSVGVIHRDIKPENILLADKEDYTVAKLTDFGLSKNIGNGSEMKTFCGTPTYIAPEMIANEHEAYSPSIDVWSMGVVLFTAIVGYPPFSEGYEDGMDLNEQIKTGRLVFNRTWKSISLAAQTIIQMMLKVNPNQRIKPSEAVEDEWFDDETREHVDRVIKQHKERRR